VKLYLIYVLVVMSKNVWLVSLEFDEICVW
jgi:hypothetical protein